MEAYAQENEIKIHSVNVNFNEKIFLKPIKNFFQINQLKFFLTHM